MGIGMRTEIGVGVGLEIEIRDGDRELRCCAM